MLAAPRRGPRGLVVALSVGAALVGCARPRTALSPWVGTSEPPSVKPALVVAPAVLDPLIAAAVESISRPAALRDLEAVAIPRHHRASPDGLERVARYVQEELTKAGFGVARQPVAYEGGQADNVVAERAGTDPSRVVIIAAHYDAVPGTLGADDNASGVAGLLGVARAAAQVKTAATVRVIAFALEEEGLIGSRGYVQALSPTDRAAVTGVLNLEMIGYLDSRAGSQRYPRGIDALVGGRALPGRGDFIGAVVSPTDARLADCLEEARSYVPGLRVEIIRVPGPLALLVPDLLRSDHGPFWMAGMPAVLVGDTADFRNPHYHRRSDVPATLDLPFLVRVTRWTAAAALLLAAEPPRREP